MGTSAVAGDEEVQLPPSPARETRRRSEEVDRSPYHRRRHSVDSRESSASGGRRYHESMGHRRHHQHYHPSESERRRSRSVSPSRRSREDDSPTRRDYSPHRRRPGSGGHGRDHCDPYFSKTRYKRRSPGGEDSGSDNERYRRPWHWRDRPPRRYRDRERHKMDDSAVGMTEEERKKKELEDARRDDLTVLVANVSLKATEDDVFQFFNTHAGKVRAVKLIKDPRSGKSKGIGYVEFDDAGAVLKSLNLTNQFILNQPIRVQASQAEKNRAARAAKQQQEQMAAQGPTKIYIGGLVDELSQISRNELRQLFSPFGTIIQIDVPKDPYTQRNRGYAFVQYAEATQARDAMLAMHGFEIGGKTIKVGFAGQDQKAGLNGDQRGLDLDRIADDHDDRILTGGASMRIALSQKLAQKIKDDDFASNTFGSNNLQNNNAWNIQNPPTGVVMLGNMFNKKEVEEDGLDVLDEIEEDVRNECLKFGLVTDIFVDREKLDGRIHVRFNDVGEAVAAYKALNGRFFGGQKIEASFTDPVRFAVMKQSALI